MIREQLERKPAPNIRPLMLIERTSRTDQGRQLDLACDLLYRRHQAALVSFVRRRGCDEHEAWDVVQELFLRMFRRGVIARLAAWGEENQRAWLLRTLRWIISNQHRDRMRLKRGNIRAHESLDCLLDAGFDVAGDATPATEYDRRWALSVLERGIARLRADMKPAVWSRVESNMWGSGHLSTPALRVAGHRARLRLREIIRRECSETALYQAASGQS
ncbi:MAG: hypothetical protein B7Z37_30245 [Verrucomicrobia bacterium 12-59-8]|nr:MAG: hypothetical protein B7Z37_30245 [Verrucomicrobia bacterium 12-59-8]